MTAIAIRRHSSGKISADSRPQALPGMETLTACRGVLTDPAGAIVPARVILRVLSVDASTHDELVQENMALHKAMDNLEESLEAGLILDGGCHSGRASLAWRIEPGEAAFLIEDPDGLAADLSIAGLAPGGQAAYRLDEENLPEPG